MKNFLLGIMTATLLLITIAASVPNDLITIKPAKPIHTVVYNGYPAIDFIVKYSKLGYVVTNSFGDGSSSTVVMCKY